MDGGNADPTLNLFKEFITPANVCGLFAKHGVPKGFDYLSIDLDTTDIWVFRAIMECEYRPRVVTIGACAPPRGPLIPPGPGPAV